LFFIAIKSESNPIAYDRAHFKGLDGLGDCFLRKINRDEIRTTVFSMTRIHTAIPKDRDDWKDFVDGPQYA
jgi:hypothetical protein